MNIENNSDKDCQTHLSRGFSSVASSIYRDNTLTYSTLLKLLDERKRLGSQSIILNEPNNTAPNKQNNQSIINGEIDSSIKPQDINKLDFISIIQRTCEIFIRVITAKIDPKSPDFDLDSLICGLTSLTRFHGFKKLVSQTSKIIETRTFKNLKIFDNSNVITDLEQLNYDINRQNTEEKIASKKKAFELGLRIKMYDKIILTEY